MSANAEWVNIRDSWKRVAEDKKLHPVDRLEACLELGFHYGVDYSNAYKWFRKALDISKQEL